jgi:TRAP-type C4-dicarboxylate transport system permease small subunit
MSRGTNLKNLLSKINSFFAEISGWFLSIITILLILNLVTRFFDVPIQGLLEISTFVFIAVIYLGLGHCEEIDDHIKVNAVLKRVPQKVRDVMYIFSYTLAIVVGGMITYAAFRSARGSFLSGEAVPGTAPLPTAPVRFIIFIGFLAFVLQAIVHIITVLKRNISKQ